MMATKSFSPEHWDMVKNSNDENIDPYDLIKDCVNQYPHGYQDGLIVNNYFADQHTGRFLNCGSNNGKDQSFQLLEKGWQGVYVEADPNALVGLLNETMNYSQNCFIFNVGLRTSTGLQQFNLSIGETNFSSSKDGWIESHLTNAHIRKIWTHYVTLTEILSLFDWNFDYIQIDLEGIDIEIIESVAWDQIKNCKLLCTEAGPAVLKTLCSQADFMLTDVTSTNAFYRPKNLILDD